MILSSSLGVRLRLGLGVRLRLRLRPRPSPRGKVGLSENLRDGKSDGVDGVVAGVGGVDDPLKGRSTDGMPRGAAASGQSGAEIPQELSQRETPLRPSIARSRSRVNIHM